MLKRSYCITIMCSSPTHVVSHVVIEFQRKKHQYCTLPHTVQILWLLAISLCKKGVQSLMLIINWRGLESRWNDLQMAISWLTGLHVCHMAMAMEAIFTLIFITMGTTLKKNMYKWLNNKYTYFVHCILPYYFMISSCVNTIYNKHL